MPRVRIVLLSWLIVLGASFGAEARDVIAGPVAAEVVRVVDGDTLIVRARIWIGQTVEVHVRLAGIDAPEIKGKCAEERASAERARAYLAALTRSGRVRLTGISSDKYGGRVIAHVASDEAPDLGAALSARGLARVYDGRKRGGWCGLAETGRGQS